MTQLKHIAQYKDFSIDYESLLKDAISKMNQNANGSVVLLKGEFPVAMLTQSDIINALGEKTNLHLNIYHYATQLLVTADEESPVEFALNLFLEHNIRRIVLIDKNKHFAGVVLQEKLFDYLGEDIYNVHLKAQMDKQLEKRLENEYLLMQQSKLATMGEMIGHIAHQWRQPLAQLGGIFMNLDASYAHKELNQEAMNKHIEKGNMLIKYMSQTIDDFRHFFEPNQTEEYFDVIRYVENAIHIIEASLTYYHIELEVICDDDIPQVKGYASEFSQVILNLLDNAKDVLIERDILVPKITIHISASKKKVMISIADNAGGIDAEFIDKIFGIYFSTKHKKGGSGLGLYMSKLILEKKGMGTIKVSNIEEGALFAIHIPLN